MLQAATVAYAAAALSSSAKPKSSSGVTIVSGGNSIITTAIIEPKVNMGITTSANLGSAMQITSANNEIVKHKTTEEDGIYGEDDDEQLENDLGSGSYYDSFGGTPSPSVLSALAKFNKIIDNTITTTSVTELPATTTKASSYNKFNNYYNFNYYNKKRNSEEIVVAAAATAITSSSSSSSSSSIISMAAATSKQATTTGSKIIKKIVNGKISSETQHSNISKTFTTKTINNKPILNNNLNKINTKCLEQNNTISKSISSSSTSSSKSGKFPSINNLNKTESSKQQITQHKLSNKKSPVIPKQLTLSTNQVVNKIQKTDNDKILNKTNIHHENEKDKRTKSPTPTTTTAAATVTGKRNDVHYLLKQLNSFSDIEEIKIFDVQKNNNNSNNKLDKSNKQDNTTTTKITSTTNSNSYKTKSILQESVVEFNKIKENNNDKQTTTPCHKYKNIFEIELSGNYSGGVNDSKTSTISTLTKTTAPTISNNIASSDGSSSFENNDDIRIDSGLDNEKKLIKTDFINSCSFIQAEQQINIEQKISTAIPSEEKFEDENLFENTDHNLLKNQSQQQQQNQSTNYQQAKTTVVYSTTTRMSGDTIHTEILRNYPGHPGTSSTFKASSSVIQQPYSAQQQQSLQTSAAVTLQKESVSFSCNITGQDDLSKTSSFFKCCYTPIDRWRERRTSIQVTSSFEKISTTCNSTSMVTTTANSNSNGSGNNHLTDTSDASSPTVISVIVCNPNNLNSTATVVTTTANSDTNSSSSSFGEPV